MEADGAVEGEERLDCRRHVGGGREEVREREGSGSRVGELSAGVIAGDEDATVREGAETAGEGREEGESAGEGGGKEGDERGDGHWRREEEEPLLYVVTRQHGEVGNREREVAEVGLAVRIDRAFRYNGDSCCRSNSRGGGIRTSSDERSSKRRNGRGGKVWRHG